MLRICYYCDKEYEDHETTDPLNEYVFCSLDCHADHYSEDFISDLDDKLFDDDEELRLFNNRNNPYDDF